MIEDISSKQKGAAIIVSLGADISSKIYKHLSEDEIESLTYEVANLKSLDTETLEGIQKEFYKLCFTQKVVAEGGVDIARSILVKAFGEESADRLLVKVSNFNRPRLFEFLKKADSKSILNIMQNEHPQTIALILSYLTSKQASEVINGLSSEKRIEVIERIAKMDKTHPEILEYVEKELEQKFKSVLSMDYEELGGFNYVADVMNHMDRSSEKSIFEELDKRDSELSEEIRMRMFVFEDILTLDDISVQRFLREVDNKDLVLAIKGANSDVVDLMYANMSKRNVDTIKSELEYTKNVRTRDVEEAQQKIVSVIRRLEDEGEIVIIKGGEDDIIA